MRIIAGGVYRVLAPASRIADELSRAGWTAIMVPPTTSTADFYRGVAAAAGFPAYFGDNLDALWDSLTDLTEPTVLIMERWWLLARAEPGGWPRLLEVLEERTHLAPPFAVVLA